MSVSTTTQHQRDTRRFPSITRNAAPARQQHQHLDHLGKDSSCPAQLIETLLLSFFLLLLFQNGHQLRQRIFFVPFSYSPLYDGSIFDFYQPFDCVVCLYIYTRLVRTMRKRESGRILSSRSSPNKEAKKATFFFITKIEKKKIPRRQPGSRRIHLDSFKFGCDGHRDPPFSSHMASSLF